MKKKKVAMVLSSSPQNGGGYQYALTVAECLYELSRSHFELVAICTESFWYKWCRERHIKYIRQKWVAPSLRQMKWDLEFPIYSRIYWEHFTEIGKLIKREQIDVLFLTEQLKYIPNLKVKIITPVHDLMHRYESRFSEVKEGYQTRELILKCQASYADYILTDSKLGKKQFIESYLSNMHRKLHIVSLPFVVPEHITNVKEAYIETPEKFMFYPAQFWKHKNHMNLLKAIQSLKSEIENIHLVLVGSEKNCLTEIMEYIRMNDLKENITIMGFVSNENITYLYKHAVGMIMPSYFGPTNIPPLEAMALGCPVAVSDKYAMPEQVGNAGLLFDPDSPVEMAGCIKRLWTDDKLRMRMIERGYQRVQKWTKDDFEKRIMNVIEKCLTH